MSICCTKRAIIRDAGYPIGQPGPCHLNCECGHTLPVPNPFMGGLLTCRCGMVYDSSGWIITGIITGKDACSTVQDGDKIMYGTS
jgi:hypothetical protein